jgi:hypothetical protein
MITRAFGEKIGDPELGRDVNGARDVIAGDHPKEDRRRWQFLRGH